MSLTPEGLHALSVIFTVLLVMWIMLTPWARWWAAIKARRRDVAQRFSGPPDDPADYIGWALRRGKPTCPDCRQADLVPGPQGGMSVNCACPNCLGRYNMAFIDTGHFESHGQRSSLEVMFFERTGKVDEPTLKQLFSTRPLPQWLRG